ncbi:MAG: hypothetical protein HEEMFOPI_02058 [Holosporales bacterium]
MVFRIGRMISFSNKNSVSNEIIKNAEIQMKIEFPDLYKKIAMEYDGETPDQDCLDFFVPELNRIISTSVHLLSFKKRWYADIIEIFYDPPEFFPQGLIAFAEDGGGNYICFDYRTCKKNPSIVFWSHEENIGEDVFFIADSFEDFINSLKSEEEMEALLGENVK